MSENILKKLSLIIPEGYIVGGVLRDYFLKVSSCDIDLILPVINKEKLKKIAGGIDAKYFILDDKTQAYRFITRINNLQIDISAFAGRSLKEDLLNRDFTFNALAYPLAGIDKEKIVLKKTRRDEFRLHLKGIKKSRVTDICGCVADIEKKVIKTPSEKSFPDDPLRMLRVFRFAAQFGFKIHKKTLHQIKQYSKKINSVSGERVQDEILKLFSFDGLVYFLKKIDTCGLLTALVPALESQRNCAEVYYGKGGVLKHTFNVVDRIEFLFENLPEIFPKFRRHLSCWREKINLLKLAALLHDIAKPETAKMIKERLRFFHHEDRGAKMAEDILAGWRFSRHNTKLISAVIKQHLRIGNLAANPIVTDRAVYRFFKDSEGFSIPLLILCWADYASYISKPALLKLRKKSCEKPFAITAGGLKRTGIKKTLRHLQVINLMFKTYFYHKPKVIPTNLINGNDVMKILNITPSPKIGEILESVRIAQVEGKVKTRQSALNYIKKFKN